MSAIYEFERGERVLICSGKRTVPQPGVVVYVGRTRCAVLVSSPKGRPVLTTVHIHDLGLRHEYLAFDKLADEKLGTMP